MPDTDDKEKKQAEKEETKTEKDEQPRQAETKTKIGILTWIIIAVVIVLLAGSGFVLGRLFAGSSSPKITKSSQKKTQTEKVVEDTKDNLKKSSSKDTWYYNDLESVVVNPDEPGATRFVRVGLILEISSELSKDKAEGLIEAKKPPLVNWLNLYFKSLTLDEMENDRDMKRILSQICDAFNEMLFPEAKPQIKRILIREFNIQ
jgi:flagellar basal body-associated protein FliL